MWNLIRDGNPTLSTPSLKCFNTVTAVLLLSTFKQKIFRENPSTAPTNMNLHLRKYERIWDYWTSYYAIIYAVFGFKHMLLPNKFMMCINVYHWQRSSNFIPSSVKPPIFHTLMASYHHNCLSEPPTLNSNLETVLKMTVQKLKT